MGKVNQLWQNERNRLERDYCDGRISRAEAAKELMRLGLGTLEVFDALDAIDEYNERGDGDQFGLGA